MSYLYDHRMAKALHEERIQRSIAKSPTAGRLIDGYLRRRQDVEADIVEVDFMACCESQPLGA